MQQESTNMDESWGIIAADPSKPQPLRRHDIHRQPDSKNDTNNRTDHRHHHRHREGQRSQSAPSSPSTAGTALIVMESLEQQLRRLLKEEENFRNGQRERQERLLQEHKQQRYYHQQQIQKHRQQHNGEALPTSTLSSSGSHTKFRRYSDLDMLDGATQNGARDGKEEEQEEEGEEVDGNKNKNARNPKVDTTKLNKQPLAARAVNVDGRSSSSDDDSDDDDDFGDDSESVDVLPVGAGRIGSIITATNTTESILLSRSLDDDDDDLEDIGKRNADDDDDDDMPRTPPPPPVYAVVVDTSKNQKSSDIRYYREITCTSSWFEEHIVDNPNNTCAKSLVAELCGIHLRIYYRNCPNEHHGSHTKSRKPINKIATMLTFDPNSGLYNHLIRGKAYVIAEPSLSPSSLNTTPSGSPALSSTLPVMSIRLSRRSVWNIQELISDHKDLYHAFGADFSREGQIQLLKACVQHKKGKWVPRSLYGMAMSNRQQYNGAGQGGIKPTWPGDNSHDPRRSTNSSRNNSTHTRDSDDTDGGMSDLVLLPTIPSSTDQHEHENNDMKGSAKASTSSQWFIDSYEIKDT